MLYAYIYLERHDRKQEVHNQVSAREDGTF